MLAGIVRRFGEIKAEEAPMPIIGEYDALAKIIACAFCNGTDSHIIEGTLPFVSSLPLILGHESVGRVVEIHRALEVIGQFLHPVRHPDDGTINNGGWAQHPADFPASVEIHQLAEELVAVLVTAAVGDGRIKVFCEKLPDFQAVINVQIAFDDDLMLMIDNPVANRFTQCRHSVPTG